MACCGFRSSALSAMLSRTDAGACDKVLSSIVMVSGAGMLLFSDLSVHPHIAMQMANERMDDTKESIFVIIIRLNIAKLAKKSHQTLHSL